MLEFLLQGGPTIYPLIVCSVIVLGVVLERLFTYRKLKNNNFRMFKKIEMLLIDGEITRAGHELKNEKGPVAKIIAAGLTQYGQNRRIVSEHISVAGEAEIHKLEKNLRILDVIASIAPLLGLLGTVIGIIGSFNILGTVGAMAGPEQLSVGIAAALISTAVGLIVAIPAMLCYSYFVTVVEYQTKEMNKWSVELLDILSHRGEEYVQV
ncbi:MAG: MotA/TolQ/ExbB proton channel family protein [Halanaerobiales bacterium]|nr:MotA/TolQ/ExbB proton channel family protein [Halanaerobiales bacterium]